MEEYEILPRTFKQAEKLGLHIMPSRYRKYKIDIYDMNSKYLFSGGDRKYSDYAHYIKSHGKKYADERRRLYHIRHKGETLRGRLIAELLW
jgi:hypothetical protein